MSTEPTNFQTLMNNGKAFSSLDGMACCYQCFDQFQFLPGHWQAKVLDFLRPQKAKPIFLNMILINNIRNNMKSNNNGGIVELLIPTFFPKKAFHEGTKAFLCKKNMGRLF